KIGVTAEHLEKARALWDKHPGKTMFFSKLSYGIAPSFFVVAGMVHMSLWKFLGFNAAIAALLYGATLIAGYFFGNAVGGSIISMINNIQIVIGVLVTGIIVFYFVRSYFRKLLLKEKENAAE
ncbi:MAG: hypothetical protein U1D26_02560, partial [Patescibacteria group bacterium]|nr:hypothetical protein [Patescibacteria group bacterium]